MKSEISNKHSITGREMEFDELKVFIHSLPPDCQENSLKDFLEAVGEFPGGVTKVYIHPKKTFAFVTVSHTDIAKPCCQGHCCIVMAVETSTC